MQAWLAGHPKTLEFICTDAADARRLKNFRRISGGLGAGRCDGAAGSWASQYLLQRLYEAAQVNAAKSLADGAEQTVEAALQHRDSAAATAAVWCAQRLGQALQAACQMVGTMLMPLISCAANLAFQGGVRSADGKAVLALVLMWSLLLLNVLADNCDGCAASTSSEIAGRPERTAPQFFA